MLKRHIHFFTATCLCLALYPFTVSAAPADSVLGFWANESSILEVKREGQTLQAIIIAARDAYYLENENLGPPGTPRRDDKNPEENLRQRNLIGLNLLSEYEHTGKRWEGKIYDPESGNTYSSRMELDDKKLKMRGYIGVPWVGRTAVFESLSRCTQAMQKLLTDSQAAPCHESRKD